LTKVIIFNPHRVLQVWHICGG